MDYRLFGFFSGFPNRRFPCEIAERLREELLKRDSFVCVSAWPADYERNDIDLTNMHGLFEECNMPFARQYLIDNRTEISRAARLIHEASCVFLMGGYPKLQLELMRNTKLDVAIRNADAVVLGLSAGSINMAKRSLDTKESSVPYNGLGLADITVKPHFKLEDEQVLSTLLQISMELPICAMEDDSAIFVAGDHISYTGLIRWVNKGKICPLLQGGLKLS
jgi:cyanophycinase-like exopeptidase